MPHEPSILVIDESDDRGRMIEDGLVAGGYHGVSRISQLRGLAAEIEARDPDVIVINLANPQRDFLEHMFRLTRAIRKPIAMFVDQSSDEAILEAMDAGVSAYVVDGLRKERIKPILDLAIARFRSFEKLRVERDAAVAALEDRKIIERARSHLMRLHGMTEDAAFALMRETAMKRSVAMAKFAHELLDPHNSETKRKGRE